MSSGTPKRLAIIDAFVDHLRGTPGMVGAEYDAPFEVKRRRPYTDVMPGDETIDLGSVQDHFNNVLMLRTVTWFDFKRDTGSLDQGLYRRGEHHYCQIVEHVFETYPQTLGGLIQSVRPTAVAPVQEVIDETTGQSLCGALTVEWRVHYRQSVRDLRVAA